MVGGTLDVRAEISYGRSNWSLIAVTNSCSVPGSAKRIQERLWQGLIEVNKQGPSVTTVAYMNSLNHLIDLDDKRIAPIETPIHTQPACRFFSGTYAAVTEGDLSKVTGILMSLSTMSGSRSWPFDMKYLGSVRA